MMFVRSAGALHVLLEPSLRRLSAESYSRRIGAAERMADMHQHLSRASSLHVASPHSFFGDSPSKPLRVTNPCLREIDAANRILVGNAGDHARVLALLGQHYQQPLSDDFQSRLDDPSYEPTDRMLVVRHRELIGHIQLSRQAAWFDSERIPITTVRDAVILPEMNPHELIQPLLETAEATALSEGAILAIARAEQTEPFAARGWSLSRAQGFTRANTRSLLSHITAQLSNRKQRHSSIEIRTWRHFELEQIQPVYEQVATGMWGTLHRSDDAWRWLVGRKSHDQILIAVKHNTDAADSARQQVVGYAVVRDSCIVEMITLPGFASVRPLLVARACRDAIDRDHHFVSLHTPPTDSMHELLVTAGGNWLAHNPHVGLWMQKLLSQEKWIERLYPVLYRRAREAGIPRPLEVGFAVDDERYRFVFTRRSVRLEHALPAANVHVRCGRIAFQDMLLGNLTWPKSVERGLLQLSDERIAPVLAALFSARIFWQSPFELLRL